MKDEIILINPAPEGFSYRGVSLNPFLYGIVDWFAKRFRPISYRFSANSPLNLLSIGTSLKLVGYKLIIIDGRCGGSTVLKIREAISDKTLFVGISSMTGNQVRYGLKCAEEVRRCDTKLPIVWGGVHVTSMPVQSLETSDYVDVVCIGEGEITVVELAKAIQNKEPLDGILGIGFKDEFGKAKINNSRPLARLDDLPLPDYGLMDPNLYSHSYLTYQSSKGCPHKCKFCELSTIYNGKYRFRSSDIVLDNLEKIANNYSPSEIAFDDENFFVNLNRAERIAQGMIDRKFKFRWRALCRADYFRKTNVEYWKTMKRSGCKAIFIGVESGSQKILDYVNKGETIEDNINAIRQLTDAGIRVDCSFVCGFPSETREDMQQTIDFIHYLIDNFKNIAILEISAYTPLPATMLYKEVVAQGAKMPETLEEWGRYVFQSKKAIQWHPEHKFVLSLNIVSKNISFPPVSRLTYAIKRLNIWEILSYLCRYTCHYRWKYQYYNFPVDIHLLNWLNQYIFQYNRNLY